MVQILMSQSFHCTIRVTYKIIIPKNLVLFRIAQISLLQVFLEHSSFVNQIIVPEALEHSASLLPDTGYIEPDVIILVSF
jgi:hypothetical protein